jgi:hypothetical protein
MKNIILYIQKFFNKKYYNRTPLGRWNIETCNKKINNKIDLANEDHCGPCGKYIIDKIIDKNKK